MMDTKTRELIAVGAAVTANCLPCLKYHFANAREAGATEKEVSEAIRVGRMVRKGAAGQWDEEADSMLEHHPDITPPAPGTSCGDV
jgi:AhpD family alkylhydroperoxidase